MLIATVGGIAALVYGSDRLVTGASRIRLPAAIVGATIVAVGTSLPELTASITASYQGYYGLVMGNVIGSNIANIGLVLSISILLLVWKTGKSIKINGKSTYVLLLIVPLSCVLLFLLSLDGSLNQIDGLVLLICFVGFVIFTVRKLKATDQNIINNTKKMENNQVSKLQIISKPKIIINIIGGILLLWVGSIFAIDGSIMISQILGINEFVIGLFIIAVGTSLPELLTVIQSARKRMYSLGIFSIIGSCILNITLVTGVASIIVSDFTISNLISIDFIIMILFVAFGSVMVLLVKKSTKITRISTIIISILILISYIIYLALRVI